MWVTYRSFGSKDGASLLVLNFSAAPLRWRISLKIYYINLVRDSGDWSYRDFGEIISSVISRLSGHRGKSDVISCISTGILTSNSRHRPYSPSALKFIILSTVHVFGSSQLNSSMGSFELRESPRRGIRTCMMQCYSSTIRLIAMCNDEPVQLEHLWCDLH